LINRDSTHAATTLASAQRLTDPLAATDNNGLATALADADVAPSGTLKRHRPSKRRAARRCLRAAPRTGAALTKQQSPLRLRTPGNAARRRT
jgi:hypothetical protein